VWRFNVGSPLKGAPVTYAIGPKQYLPCRERTPRHREIRQSPIVELLVRVRVGLNVMKRNWRQAPQFLFSRSLGSPLNGTASQSRNFGTLLLAFTTTESNLLFAADNAEISIQDTDAVAAAKADKHNGRRSFYVGRGRLSGALYLFKLVLAQDRGSGIRGGFGRLTNVSWHWVCHQKRKLGRCVIHNFRTAWSAVALDALRRRP